MEENHALSVLNETNVGRSLPVSKYTGMAQYLKLENRSAQSAESPDFAMLGAAADAMTNNKISG